MARGFNERERETIQQKLMDAAEVCWGKYGLKKTSVDELVAMANISKGSFYLFYPTKEHLFMDVFDRIDLRSKAELFNIVQNTKGSRKDVFVSVLKQMFNEVKKTPWILDLQNGDLQLLMRKLPPERMQSHLKDDDSAADQLFNLMDIKPITDPKLISGVMRSVFLLLLHKQEIGEEIFDDVINYMIDSIVLKLFEEA
jgi:AcrR family transcriptional regulator